MDGDANSASCHAEETLPDAGRVRPVRTPGISTVHEMCSREPHAGTHERNHEDAKAGPGRAEDAYVRDMIVLHEKKYPDATRDELVKIYHQRLKGRKSN